MKEVGMKKFKLEINLSFIFICLLNKLSHGSGFVPVGRSAFSIILHPRAPMEKTQR